MEVSTLDRDEDVLFINNNNKYKDKNNETNNKPKSFWIMI